MDQLKGPAASAGTVLSAGLEFHVDMGSNHLMGSFLRECCLFRI